MIGMLLFLVAAIAVAAVIRWKGQRSIEHETPRAGTAESPLRELVQSSQLAMEGNCDFFTGSLGLFFLCSGSGLSRPWKHWD